MNIVTSRFSLKSKEKWIQTISKRMFQESWHDESDYIDISFSRDNSKFFELLSPKILKHMTGCGCIDCHIFRKYQKMFFKNHQKL